RTARSGRGRWGLAWFRREPADPPTESPVVAVSAGDRARGPGVVVPLPIRERCAEVDPTRGVEGAVVRRRLCALNVVLGEAEGGGAVRSREKARAVAAVQRGVHADNLVDDP